MRKCALLVHIHAQSGLTLHDPNDYRPQSSSVHETFQARILEWFSISSSVYSQPRNKKTHSKACTCQRVVIVLERSGKLGMGKSIPKLVNKKSRFPEEERGVWDSRKEMSQFSHSFVFKSL